MVVHQPVGDVGIDVVDPDRDRGARMRRRGQRHHRLEPGLALGEALRVEIADRDRQGGGRGVGGQAVAPAIALPAVGMLRRVQRIEPGDQVGGHQDRIDQHPLGRHRMRGDAGDGDGRLGRVESLGDELAQRAAIDGVGELGREARQVHRLGAAQPDLLVRHERHQHVAMRRPFPHQRLEQRHHHRHRRLVVGAQDAGAVGDDQRLADIGQQLRVLRDAHPDHALRVQAQIGAVERHEPRMDVRREPDIDRVDMGAEADPGRALDRAGQTGGQHRMVVEMDVGQAELLELALQQPGHVPLPRRAGHHCRAGIALAGDGEIAEQAPDQTVGESGGRGSGLRRSHLALQVCPVRP